MSAIACRKDLRLSVFLRIVYRLTMATSLAAQLKKLRTPQTNLLLQDKKRPSLLFDPKEAANLDRDTVLSIG